MHSFLANEVRAAFDALDAETTELQRSTGLACPSGCGLCCLTPAVETSVLEMLPMAQELFRRGEAETWIARLRVPTERMVCPVYEPAPEGGERGRCGMYAWRPPVCRLYGFAGRHDRRGLPELIVCPEHERETPEVVERARALVEGGLALPLFSAATTHLASLGPTLGMERMPIGRALLRALEIVGLEQSLADLDRGANAPAADDVSCRTGGPSRASLTPAERPWVS
jgi:Fe-S-cluster containining protein